MSDHPTEVECRKVLEGDIDVVATAICRADGQDWDALHDTYNGRMRCHDYRRYAQAAIAAMVRLTRPTVDRNAVLEEAAEAVAGLSNFDDSLQRASGCSTAGERAAARIRALKEPTND